MQMLHKFTMIVLGYSMLLLVLLCGCRAQGEPCSHLKIGNGRFYWSSYDKYPEYYFPKSNGDRVDYVCNDGFATESGYASASMTCTRNGWSPPPKCLRKCLLSRSSDMNIDYEQSVYTAGATVSYQCHKGFTNAEGSEHGILECLPDGLFSEAKCTRACIVPSTSLKNYKPSKKVFYLNERLQYECEDGYKSQKNNLVEKAECSWRGWTPTPQCQEITCSLEPFDFFRYHLSTRSRLFKDGDVVKFNCKWYKLKRAEKAQCYYFGWYPERPRCEEDFNPDSSDGGGADAAIDEECPQAPLLVNTADDAIRHVYRNGDTVTYTCKTNYTLYGSKTITCQNGRWTSPPQCIERELCAGPPPIRNGKSIVHDSSRILYSGDTVTYRCEDGYRLSGSDESICIGGQWSAAPTCTESPCDQGPPIEFGSVADSRPPYAHGSTVQLKCDSGYTLSSQREPKCEKGKWLDVPQCKYTACGPAPQGLNAEIVDPKKQNYSSGERAFYKCEPKFDFEKLSYATCNEGQWTNSPVCRKIGEKCGPAPHIANGDITGLQQLFFESGTSVTYKCQSYHIMEGSPIVSCRNGAWSAWPDCLEPCTAVEEEMAANNLQLAHRDQSKLYLTHGDTIEFNCIRGYIKVERLEFRTKCVRGKFMYPRCIKYGSCVVSSSEMDLKNIILQRENLDIPDGEGVVFACKPGFFQKPNQNMRVSCLNGKLDYPECGKNTCILLQEKMIEYSIQLLPGTERKIYLENSEQITFSCKEGFEKHPTSGDLTQKCVAGIIAYPICIHSGVLV